MENTNNFFEDENIMEESKMTKIKNNVKKNWKKYALAGGALVLTAVGVKVIMSKKTVDPGVAEVFKDVIEEECLDSIEVTEF